MQPKSTVKQSKGIAYLLFLVWPFFSLVYSLINYRASYAKNILWLFITFFGFTFVIASEGVDANFYRDRLIEYHSLDIGLFSFIELVADGVYGRGDYGQPVLTYIISRFTDDYRVLFAFFGLVMGYFYSRNIWYLLEKAGKPIKQYAWPFIIFFAFIIPFWQINGVRFWIAAHMFAFGAFRVLIDKRWRYLLVAAGSVLVHIGFAFAVALLLGFILLGNRKIIFISFFLVSIFLVNLDIPTIIELVPKPNESLNSRIDSYSNKDFVKKMATFHEGEKWFVEWKKKGINYLAYILIGIFILFYRKKIKDFKLESLFYFGMLMISISSVLDIIPSMGRFFLVSHFFIFSFVFLFLQKNMQMNWVKNLLPILLLPILLHIALELRFVIEFCGLGTFINNPLLVAFFEYKTALIEYIK